MFMNIELAAMLESEYQRQQRDPGRARSTST